MLQNTILELGSYTMSVGQLLLLLILIALWIFSITKGKSFINRFFNIDQYEDKSGFHSLFTWNIHILFAILVIHCLDVNIALVDTNSFELYVTNVLFALFIIQLARGLDWISQHYFDRTTKKYSSDKSIERIKPKTGSYLVQLILGAIVLLMIIQNFGLDRGFSTSLSADQSINIQISNIIMAALVILVARLFYWILTNILLQGFYLNKEVDEGVQFAFNQLLAYIIYTIAIILALQSLGINMTLILGGAAALLVGIGLGLQQTFADFFAGIVLLFERSVKIGDVLELENTKGTVKKIGLRTSTIVTPREQSLVIPNSMLTNQKVTNWTHLNRKLRFEITVGVGYESDVDLVQKLLLESVKNHPSILKTPAPFVLFMNFGDSSLDFGIFFFSTNHLIIENIKSDVRFEINRLFRKHNIKIPYPQSEIHISNTDQ